MEGFVNGDDLAALELDLINIWVEDDCLIDDVDDRECCECILSIDDMKEEEDACASKVMATNSCAVGWENGFFTTVEMEDLSLERLEADLFKDQIWYRCSPKLPKAGRNAAAVARAGASSKSGTVAPRSGRVQREKLMPPTKSQSEKTIHGGEGRSPITQTKKLAPSPPKTLARPTQSRVPSKTPVTTSSTRTPSIPPSKTTNPSLSASVPRGPRTSTTGNRTPVAVGKPHAQPKSTSKSSSSFITTESVSRRNSDRLSIAGQKLSIKPHDGPESEIPASAKPSGPKIGFVDRMKTAARTPKRNTPTRSPVPAGLPKIGDDARNARRVPPKVNPGKHNGNLEPTLPLKPIRGKNSSASRASTNSSRKAIRSPAVARQSNMQFRVKFDLEVHEEVSTSKNEASSCSKPIFFKDSILKTDNCPAVEEQVHEDILENTNSGDSLSVDTAVKTPEFTAGSSLNLDFVQPLVMLTEEAEDFPSMGELDFPHLQADQRDKTESSMITELPNDSSLNIDSDMIMNETHMLAHMESDECDSPGKRSAKALMGMNIESDICMSQLVEVAVESSQTGGELAAASNFCKSSQDANSLVMGRCASPRIPLAVRNSLLDNHAFVGLHKAKGGKKVVRVPNLIKTRIN